MEIPPSLTTENLEPRRLSKADARGTPDGSGHRRHRRGVLRQAALPMPLAQRGTSDRSTDGCARRAGLLLRSMLALLPFGAAVGEDAVSSPEEVLSY